jgi:hypothetical protein
MRKVIGLALVAAVSLALVPTGADAARTIRGSTTNQSNGNGDITCVVDCLTIGNPNNTPKPDCRPVRGPVTLAPLREAIIVNPHRNPCAGVSADVQACGQKLGNLRRVTVSQVRRIDNGDSVHLVPICDTVHRSLTEEEMSFLARGNVQGLIKPIGQNDTLEAALDDGGYRADNVIGIVLDPQAVTLYVSRARQ